MFNEENEYVMRMVEVKENANKTTTQRKEKKNKKKK